MPFRICDANSERPLKCPRQNLLLLGVEAIRCPIVEGQILRVLNSESVAPADIMIEREAGLQWIAALFDPKSYRPSANLMKRIERMPSVGNVRMIAYADRPIRMPSRPISGKFVSTAL